MRHAAIDGKSITPPPTGHGKIQIIKWLGVAADIDEPKGLGLPFGGLIREPPHSSSEGHYHGDYSPQSERSSHNRGLSRSKTRFSPEQQ